jgi:GNAT superfamily N-acetyltransferase
MDVIIRPAKTADIPSLCSLLSELFLIESDFSPDSQKQAKGLSLILTDRSGSAAVLVAEKEDEIVGMCSVQTLISTAEGGPAGFVEDLVVRKDCRGNGIGSRLLSEILTWCDTKGISRVQLLRDSDNNNALTFYAANGWRSTKLVCMRKCLQTSRRL